MRLSPTSRRQPRKNQGPSRWTLPPVLVLAGAGEFGPAATVRALLAQAGGDSAAARLLGVSRPMVQHWVREYL
jgi:hypothetical protein